MVEPTGFWFETKGNELAPAGATRKWQPLQGGGNPMESRDTHARYGWNT